MQEQIPWVWHAATVQEVLWENATWVEEEVKESRTNSQQKVNLFTKFNEILEESFLRYIKTNPFKIGFS